MSSNGFDKITVMKQQLQTAIRDEGVKILKVELERVLALLPEVECILWAQSNNVYDDESYNFEVLGFDFLPNKNCPWYKNLIDELDYSLGNSSSKKDITDRLHFNGESIHCLSRLAKKNSNYAERMLFIQKTLSDLKQSIPEEVFYIFGDAAIHIDRDGFTFQEYDYGY